MSVLTEHDREEAQGRNHRAASASGQSAGGHTRGPGDAPEAGPSQPPFPVLLPSYRCLVAGTRHTEAGQVVRGPSDTPAF